MLAAFAAIAGIGGTTNTLLSNYALDNAWGMGKLVGAIPSAVGGSTVTLSHVGKVFPVDENNLRRWRGWMRYILRDQVIVWMLCCFVGMALPCMISLEFIRNVSVEGHRVSYTLRGSQFTAGPDKTELVHAEWAICLRNFFPGAFSDCLEFSVEQEKIRACFEQAVGPGSA